MDIRYTSRAVKDLSEMDAETKRQLKEAIENLPDGKLRKLMDYSTAFRLQVYGHCVVFEERLKKNQAPLALVLNRNDLYKSGALYLAIHKFISKPTMSWIEEIESVREGREDLKNGSVTMHEDVAWD
jgi:mRNA-degrading endonuclease RelE of RelBE toxin-antitoxin system